TGDKMETWTAEVLPASFNANNDDNASFDGRSDNSGPEPEGVTVGRFFGRTYAFVGLERVGGIMVFDLSDPSAPSPVLYRNDRDFDGVPEDGSAGDLGPEGLTLISLADSPSSDPLLAVTNEVSGTTTIYAIVQK
ncbi:MAG: choice-of-anchor I domain-containing protein, partial [Nannocystaceae bacterium]